MKHQASLQKIASRHKHHIASNLFIKEKKTLLIELKGLSPARPNIAKIINLWQADSSSNKHRI